MSSELSVLGLYGLFVMVVIVLQALAAAGQVGLVELAKDRSSMPPLTGIAGRMNRAQLNSVVALALFAPAILLLHVQGISTPTTVLTAQAFLIARIAYVAVYAAGIPWLRTGVWAVGFVSTSHLYLAGL